MAAGKNVGLGKRNCEARLRFAQQQSYLSAKLCILAHSFQVRARFLPVPAAFASAFTSSTVENAGIVAVRRGLYFA